MQTREIISKDGLSLHMCHWGVDSCEAPKAILIVHGLGEHSGRYKHVASFFIRNGWSMYSYDQRGHGKSGGKRGHSPSVEHNLDDLRRVIESIPEKQVVIYGHSFGGNVVANFLVRSEFNNLIKRRVKKAILSSAWLKLHKEPSLTERLAAKIISKIAPSFSQSNKLDANELSYLPEVASEYLSDPLNHDRISVSLFTNFYKSGIYAIENASKLNTPTLVIHGKDDRIISPKGSIEFTRNTNDTATLKLYPNTKHEPHNDQSSCAILTDINTWLTSE